MTNMFIHKLFYCWKNIRSNVHQQMTRKQYFMFPKLIPHINVSYPLREYKYFCHSSACSVFPWKPFLAFLGGSSCILMYDISSLYWKLTMTGREYVVLHYCKQKEVKKIYICVLDAKHDAIRFSDFCANKNYFTKVNFIYLRWVKLSYL